MSTNLMGIGQTVSSLRHDFPDISVSKIRFLEAEGLVEPLRTPSGYRKYTPAHVRADPLRADDATRPLLAVACDR